jgi:hypothetical protein
MRKTGARTLIELAALDRAAVFEAAPGARRRRIPTP